MKNQKKQGVIGHDSPIIKLVNLILYRSVKDRASDIYIEPFEEEIKVRYRIDGTLYEILSLPKKYQAAIISCIKDMANLDIAENRHPQYGSLTVKLTNKEVDVMVSVIPATFGERIVMDLLIDWEISKLGDKEKAEGYIEKTKKKPFSLYDPEVIAALKKEYGERDFKKFLQYIKRLTDWGKKKEDGKSGNA